MFWGAIDVNLTGGGFDWTDLLGPAAIVFAAILAARFARFNLREQLAHERAMKERDATREILDSLSAFVALASDAIFRESHLLAKLDKALVNLNESNPPGVGIIGSEEEVDSAKDTLRTFVALQEEYIGARAINRAVSSPDRAASRVRSLSAAVWSSSRIRAPIRRRRARRVGPRRTRDPGRGQSRAGFAGRRAPVSD